MTVIVAVTDGSNVYMGSDSAISSDKDVFGLKTEKIIKKDGLLIGVSGVLRGLQLLKYNWDIPEQPSSMSNEEYIITMIVQDIKGIFNFHGYSLLDDNQEIHDSHYLIGYRGSIFTLDSNYQVFETNKQYAAIGSGAYFALGALSTLEDTGIIKRDPAYAVNRSIEVAKEFCPTVSGDTRIYSV